jgi:hypothetical protein
MYLPPNPFCWDITVVNDANRRAAWALLAAILLLAATLPLVVQSTATTAPTSEDLPVSGTVPAAGNSPASTTAHAGLDSLVSDAALAGAAPALPAPVGSSVDQLRQDFARRGYRVEPSIDWQWLSPPVTTFRVHDPHGGRALLVQVFADEAEALRAQQWAAPVPCYASSIWARNVALFQSTEDSLRACMAAAAPDGMGPGPDHTRTTTELAARRASVDPEFVSLVLENA